MRSNVQLGHTVSTARPVFHRAHCRTRAGDIPALLRHFLEEGWEIDPEAERALESYHWPGNVRQLCNVLQRAMILADDRTVTIDDLPREVVGGSPAETRAGPVAAQPTTDAVNSERLEDLQRFHIASVLERERGNKARTARVLGIHRRKLYRLLERFGIE